MSSKNDKNKFDEEEFSAPKWMRPVLGFLLFMALGAGGMYLAMPHILKSDAQIIRKENVQNKKDKIVPVEAVTASEMSMMDTLTVTATLEAGETATIRPEVTGRVISIPFIEGKTVKKGDILFKLDDSVQRAVLAQAQANMSFARNNARRYDNLLDSRAISRTEAEQAGADLKSSLANVALAQANLSKMTIRAPFDGTVGIRNVSVGTVVDPGVELVTITQTKPLRILFELPEKYLPNIAINQPVRFTVSSHPDKVFTGIIAAIDSQIDPVSRSVKVKATIPNEDGALLSGQFASLAFGLNRTARVIAIPEAALVPEGRQVYVYKIDADNRVQKTNVEPGLRDGVNVEIKTGVNAGDKIVTAGQQKLFQDTRVQILPPTKITITPPSEEESSR